MRSLVNGGMFKWAALEKMTSSHGWPQQQYSIGRESAGSLCFLPVEPESVLRTVSSLGFGILLLGLVLGGTHVKDVTESGPRNSHSIQ